MKGEKFAQVGIFGAKRYVKGGSIFIEIPFGKGHSARSSMRWIKGEKIEWD